MRLDYTVYTLAIVFFSITIMSFILLTETSQTLWALISAALGAISIVVGIVQTRSVKNNQNK
jgi:hypothetical protein